MRRTGYILVFDFFLLALCVLGVFRLSQKSGFPARFEGTRIVELKEDVGSSLRVGDSLVSISGQQLHYEDEIEFFCNQYNIGESINLELSDNGYHRLTTVPLISDYPPSKIIIECFAAIIFFLVGIGVLRLQNQEKAAIIFHHLCVAIGTLILLTPGIYKVSYFGFGYVHELFFYLSYTLVPVLFFHFTVIFPHEKFLHTRKVLIPLYSLGIILGLIAFATFLHSAYPAVDLYYYPQYSRACAAILIFFAVLFLSGFGNIIHSYIIAKEELDRRKLRWNLFGIIFGACAYIFFSVIPRIFTHRILLPEEFLIAFSVIAPISFAFAIVRYRVFDIDLIFNRSSVYTLVITLLLGVYLSFVWLFTHIVIITKLPIVLPNIVGAMLIALLFEPIRKRSQKFIDKKFFRISYDFYEAQRRFIDELKFVSTTPKLANLLVERLDQLLLVTKIGFFTVESPNDRLQLIAHHGFDILERRKVQLDRKDLKSTLELPVALENRIEPGIPYELADPEVFKRWGIALVLPMLSANHTILGFLILGEKRSATRFTVEDISLLLSASTQAGFTLERLKVEYELIVEQTESERLTELNRLKSYFVSSVSHDLRTPLTSIRMFAELLREQENIPREKAIEYLSIIEGEADRLARLIANVLDFAKIEKGTKEYSFKEIDLNKVVGDVIHSLQYQVHLSGFAMTVELSEKPILSKIDRDAVFDTITNLITNAMKYSPPDRKRITVATAIREGCGVLSIRDEGYGIAETERPHIFEAFYRIDDPQIKAAGGAGLGLSLVKHTMEAHKGKVEVESEVGKGSIFALYFPIEHL